MSELGIGARLGVREAAPTLQASSEIAQQAVRVDNPGNRPYCPAVRHVLLILTIVLAGVGASAGQAVGQRQSVSSLRVIRVGQNPTYPVAIRVGVQATVGHRLHVGYKIFDDAGHGVYSSSGSSSATFKQPYASTALTLRWNKVAYDGSRVSRGEHLRVVAFATDLSANKQKLYRSSPVAFTLVV